MTRRGLLDDLAAFAAVARSRSFTEAAPELGLSTSALSYTVRRLESRLGVRLLQRNSRSVAPTEAGERLLQTLRPALEDVSRALVDLDRTRADVSGVVRITATRQAYEAVLRPALPVFAARHPKACVEVLIEYDFRDIIADRLDAGIRMGEKLEQDMISVRVGPDLRMAVVGTPAYLHAHPAPSNPDALSSHRCIGYRMRTGGRLVPWEFEFQGREVAVDVSGPLVVNEPELALDAALDGLGLAYVLEDRARPYLEAGRLNRLLEDWTPPFLGFFLYYPSRRQLPPTLAALVQILRR
jgi:DNA-binding transcriptional LysR family regulator